MKINLDTSTKDRLLSQGCDIDTFYKKYARGESELGTNINTQSSRKKTSSRKLDDIRICQICHGIGITKTIYNHMVMQENCITCHQEGIVMENSIGNIKKEF